MPSASGPCRYLEPQDRRLGGRAGVAPWSSTRSTRSSWRRTRSTLSAAAWIATQELRHVYGAHDLAQARARLFTFYRICADSPVPELHRLARTITAWQDQLLAYFTTGRASLAPVRCRGETEVLREFVTRASSCSAGEHSPRR